MNIAQTVSLIPETHPVYQKLNRRFASRSDSSASDPLAVEYFAKLKRWESATLRLLSELLPRSAGSCVLASLQRTPGQANWYYRELDLVLGDVETPTHFVELKLRERGYVAGIWRQLSRSLRIARNRWPRVQGISICVHMAEVLNLQPEHRTTPLADLGRWVQSLDGKKRTVKLSGSEIARRACQQGLLSNSDVHDLAATRRAMLAPTTQQVPADQPEPAGLFDQFRHLACVQESQQTPTANC